jgi:hypothetical protein
MIVHPSTGAQFGPQSSAPGPANPDVVPSRNSPPSPTVAAQPRQEATPAIPAPPPSPSVPAIPPDDAAKKVRPEDFLPYFQFPGAEPRPSDVNAADSAPSAQSAPKTIPPSSATYQEQ